MINQSIEIKEKTKNRKRHKKLKIFLSAFAVFLAALLLFVTYEWKDEVVSYETTNPYITENGKTLVSAHRSGSGIFPENTMMAFEGCINSETFKTDIFEFDLHITADGELILLHDDTLDRTTNAVEYFGKKRNHSEDYTYEELQALNFGENFENLDGEMPYKGLRGDDIPGSLRVAKLLDVLTYLEANGDFRYVIEIKNSGKLGFDATDALYEILTDMDLLDKVIVGTFNGEVTKYIDESYPDIVRSAGITEAIVFYLDCVVNAQREENYYKFAALQISPHKYVVNLATPRFINYAHKNNIAVQYWTINDAEDMAHLQEIGADCVMTDIPDVACQVLYGEQ